MSFQNLVSIPPVELNSLLQWTKRSLNFISIFGKSSRRLEVTYAHLTCSRNRRSQRLKRSRSIFSRRACTQFANNLLGVLREFDFWFVPFKCCLSWAAGVHIVQDCRRAKWMKRALSPRISSWWCHRSTALVPKRWKLCVAWSQSVSPVGSQDAGTETLL